MDNSVNSLNSSYVAKTKSLSFKTTKSLFPISLAPFKNSACIEILLVENFQMRQFLIQ